MISKKIKLALLSIILLLTLQTTAASAYYVIPNEYKPSHAPLDIFGNYDSTRKDQNAAAKSTVFILQIIAGGLLYFAAPIAVISIILSSFTIVTGGAESEQLETGKKQLTWAILGLLLIILSYSLVEYIIRFTIDSGEQAIEEAKAEENQENSKAGDTDANNAKSTSLGGDDAKPVPENLAIPNNIGLIISTPPIAETNYHHSVQNYLLATLPKNQS